MLEGPSIRLIREAPLLPTCVRTASSLLSSHPTSLPCYALESCD